MEKKEYRAPQMNHRQLALRHLVAVSLTGTTEYYKMDSDFDTPKEDNNGLDFEW